MGRKFLEQYIKWLLPLLFIFFINGKTLYTHAHVIDDILVVHSHPFKKGETTPHNHTSKELIAIDFHTHSYSTDAIIPHIEINSPLFIFIQHSYKQKDKTFLSAENSNVLLRAPPQIS